MIVNNKNFFLGHVIYVSKLLSKRHLKTVYNWQQGYYQFLTFVTTLNVAFFSSVSEHVTVTRSKSVPGVVGLKIKLQLLF